MVIVLGVKSFMLNVAGFTCVTFTTGALAFFGPTYVKLVSKSCSGFFRQDEDAIFCLIKDSVFLPLSV
jgi:uncharacterized membrane protein